MSDERASRSVSLGVARSSATAAAGAAATESVAEAVAMLRDLVRKPLEQVAPDEARVTESRRPLSSATTRSGH